MSECRFKETSRDGLYIMVFIIMLQGCDSSVIRDKVVSLSEQLDRIESVITKDAWIELEAK